MYKNSEKGKVYIAIYVDDLLLIGNKDAINCVIEEIKGQGLKIKETEDLKDYLSCELVESEDKSTIWIHQPHLLEKLDKFYGYLVNKSKVYATPGTPRISIIRGIENYETPENQKIFRSVLGMLLYLVKHTRPDIANCVRELAKVLDKATIPAFKEMKRVLKYVLDTRNLALKLSPRLETEETTWKIYAYSNSDYAGDKDNQKSISGCILFVNEVPISWRSKGQSIVTLSSSKAELIALTETAKEVKFVAQLLMSLDIKVEMPIIIKVDNQGAIFIAENVNVSPKTKHIDVRYHFIREFIFEGFIKVVFVRTEKNVADVFTKNVPQEINKRHMEGILEERPNT